MRTRGKEKRHARLYFLVVLVLLIVIVVVGWKKRNYVSIMPPEAPEIAEKRRSPDNAYFALEALLEELPDPPAKLIVKGDERSADVEYYELKEGSLGSIVDVARPDDDPLLLEYIEYGDTLSKKLKPIFEEPFLLSPEIYGVNRGPHFANAWKYQQVSRLMIARAEFLARADSKKALELLVNSLKFGRIVTPDCSEMLYRTALSLQNDSLMHIVAVARNADSVDALLAARDALQQFSETDISPSSNVEYVFRSLDVHYREGNVIHRQPRSNTDDKLVDMILNSGAFIDDCFNEWQEKIWLKSYRKNWETYLEVCAMPHSEFRKWAETNPLLAETFEQGWLYVPSWTGIHSYTLSQYRGTRLVVALESHQNEHKAYPGTLNQLVPEFIDEVPIDPYDGKQFKYRALKDDYVLYSVGPHGDGDDGGKIAYDVIIHGPQDEIEDR